MHRQFYESFIIYLAGMDIEQRVPEKTYTIRTAPSLPWVEKYRPSHLNELISHQSILSTLKTFIVQGNLPNLLFYGPPGTGKTSTIVAVARELYGKDFKSMVMQLNASDQRGIGVVREQIKKFADTKALSNNRNLKLIILDEADMMTNVAQFALRRIIEKYHNNARFCLISNYVSKIIPALQSRCTRFKFKQIALNDAKPRIQNICNQQVLKLTDDGVEAAFKLCSGDMRRVVNMLQSLSMIEFDGQIDANTIYQFTGNPSPNFLQKILDVLLNQQVTNAYEWISTSLKQRGVALQTILKSIYLLILERRMPSQQQAFLVNRLGDIEYRLSIGCQQSMALGSLIAAFTEIRYIAAS